MHESRTAGNISYQFTTSPDFYLFLLFLVPSLVGQLYYLNDGLRHFDATLVVPVYQSLIVILGVVFGFIYWNESSGLGANLAGFLVGIFLIVAALLLLLLKHKSRPIVRTVASAVLDLFNLHDRAARIRRIHSDAAIEYRSPDSVRLSCLRSHSWV
jgi:hypothetical protein